MSYPEKRGDKLTGRWYGELWVKKVRFRAVFDSKKAADGYEAYVKATGAEPPGHHDALLGPTFKEVAQECKLAGGPKGKWKRGRDDSVLQRIDHVVSLLGDKPVGAITTADLERLTRDLERRPGRKRGGTTMSAGTVNRYLTAASAVLTFAKDSRRYIESKPKVPWRDEGGNERFYWLTEPQERGVCAWMVAKGYESSAFTTRVLTATGMRWGELEGLEPDQIEDTWLRLWETKTDSPRSIPIEPEMARELRALVAAGALPKYQTYRKHLKAALKACGYSSEISVHALRHTTGTRFVERGVNQRVIQKFLGHRNSKTTERYTHVSDETLVEAAKKLHPQRGDLSENTTGGEVVPFSKAL